MRQYQTYIFDFDYTLADSSAGIVMCYQHVLRAHGYHNIDDETIKRTIGKTLVDSFAELTGEHNMEVLVSYRKQYEQKADSCMTLHTYLFPETAEVLTQLKNKGAKLGIVSSKYRSRIQELTDVAFPEGFFDLIVGAEDVTMHKPAPEGLLFALRHTQTNVADALYVGDSTIDAETAQSASVDFCGILHGMTTYDELVTYPHQVIGHDLKVLL